MSHWRRALPQILVTVSLALTGEVSAQPCTLPRPGLVSWWDADGASGTKIADLKGDNPGLIVGGVTIRPDRAPGPRDFKSSFDFDGES
jgi:hypothetical protein